MSQVSVDGRNQFEAHLGNTTTRREEAQEEIAQAKLANAEEALAQGQAAKGQEDADRLERLGAGLAALREADHWGCRGDLLELCGVTLEDVEKVVKKWWGNKALWLDMLATEMARGIAEGAGVGDESWDQATDTWLDETYAQATQGMSCPPSRSVLRNFAAKVVAKLLQQKAAPGGIYARRTVVQVPTLTCGRCGQGFSRSLGECPACFPRAPPPDRAPSPSEEEAWETLPSACIREPAWGEASRLAWREGNSGGTFLLQLPSGAVCVKGGDCSVTELFAQRLATALGVRGAEVRVVPATSEENWAMRVALRGCAEKQRLADKWSGDGFSQLMLRVQKNLSKTNLAVMEFIGGCVLMGLPANQVLFQADGETRHGIWRQLGRLMALDLLLNNLDRLPLAWTNDGNLGNVMLRGHEVVGIDHAVHPILHPEGLQRYLDRVREAALEARDGGAKHFGAVAATILTNTGVELAADEVQSLRGGCLELLRQVLQKEASGELEQVLTAVSAECLRAFPKEEGPRVAAPQASPCKVTSCSDLVCAVASVLKEAIAEPGEPSPASLC